MADSLANWAAALSHAALLGTGRRPVPAAPAGFPVPDGAAEATLLGQLALRRAWCLAGTRPEEGVDVPDAPRDPRPEASARAAQLLDTVLDLPVSGGWSREAHLRTWARECARAGLRVPVASLPRVLAFLRGHPEVREEVIPVLGAQGLWLARQNPEWQAVAASAPVAGVARDADDGSGPSTGVPGEAGAAAAIPESWRREPRAAQVATLTAVRRTHPGRAREAIEEVWGSAAAADRKAYLETLAEGLGAEDEALLERALDDRAKSVREAARELLAQCCGSDFQRRMGERLAPLLHAERKGLRHVLRIDLPEPPDAAGLRDGLLAPAGDVSHAHRNLTILTRCAPAGTWTATGARPDRVVTALAAQGGDAVTALAAAVVRDRHIELARAIAASGRLTGDMLALLPTDELEQLLTSSAVASLSVATLASVLGRVPGPWSRALSEAVIRALAAKDAHTAATRAHVLVPLAERLHPSLLAELEQWRDTQPADSPRAATLTVFLNHARLHSDLCEAFR